jgi:3-methylcrotonyl-CoA carboxylase alpha subunit
MFSKILIANRGEIACRIVRTARRMGITTVAVYSDADANSLHVEMADEAIHIGGAPARESYLLNENILEAALTSGAEAIHPGYGFLSENALFARRCEEHGITFIGPPPAAIEAMGSKSAAKRIMEAANVPLVPGYHGENQSDQCLRDAANNMGYPVLIKATAGGGGKGMRQVYSDAKFIPALEAARRESLSSFGDDTMLVERYLAKPRHVEIQVFFDNEGNGIYLAERDCSVQRRHQKVIEEAPAPGMTGPLRSQMGEAAVKAAKAIDYRGAGTVEFLLEENGNFYFMEMNTRLQVEHPVTEMITGQDLVEWQLLVAFGLPLPLKQEEVGIRGHAFEARIYAEDPDNDFLPVTGMLGFLRTPDESDHVRVDTGIREGDEISVHYDPMIAKLITWDESRERALQRMRSALTQYRIGGTKTNIDFLYNLITSKPFAEAQLDTGFIENHREKIFHQSARDLAFELPRATIALLLHLKQSAATTLSGDTHSPWNKKSSWRMNQTHKQAFTLHCHDMDHLVSIAHVGNQHSEQCGPQYENQYRVVTEFGTTDIVAHLDDDVLMIEIDGYRQRGVLARTNDEFTLYLPNGACHFRQVMPDTGEDEGTSQSGQLAAPMNGTIVALLVEAGATVEEGTPLLVLEAMKMEQTICAPTQGTVQSFYYQPGDLVDGGAELLDFTQTEDSV